MHRQLGDGPVALDCRQRHLRLERRVVLLPCPLHVLLPRYPRFLGAGIHLSHLSHFRGPAQATSSLHLIDGVPAMPQPNDLSRSLVAVDQNSTIIAVVELSQSSWLVAGTLPGIEHQPHKKLEPSPERLLGLLHRW